jgi:hypothetical protein
LAQQFRAKRFSGRPPHAGHTLDEPSAAARFEPCSSFTDFNAGEFRHAAQQLDHFEQPSVEHVGELAGLAGLVVSAERVHGVAELLVAQRQRVAGNQRQPGQRRVVVEFAGGAPSSARFAGFSFHRLAFVRNASRMIWQARQSAQACPAC